MRSEKWPRAYKNADLKGFNIAVTNKKLPYTTNILNYESFFSRGTFRERLSEIYNFEINNFASGAFSAGASAKYKMLKTISSQTGDF